MFKKLFLPVGMLLAVLLSFICPSPGIFVKELGCNSLLIVIIFFICGWTTDTSGAKFDRRFTRIFIFGAVAAMVIAPLLGLATAKVFRMAVLPATGLIVAAAMPPTLSSGIVMTQSANGNMLLSILMTVAYNLIGVFSIPLILGWTLDSGEIDADPLKMFIELLLLVMLPSLIGFGIKKLSGKKLPAWSSYIPSICVILLILGFFSKSRDHFLSHPLTLLLLEGAGALILHLVLIAMMWFGGKLLGAGVGECKALLFTGASKTITIALTTLTIIGADSGEAMVPCLVYYFVQSVIDAVIAGKMGMKKEQI